jgi:hypothetical protein
MALILAARSYSGLQADEPFLAGLRF